MSTLEKQQEKEFWTILQTECMSTLEREKEVGGCNLDGQNLEYGKGTLQFTQYYRIGTFISNLWGTIFFIFYEVFQLKRTLKIHFGGA